MDVSMAGGSDEGGRRGSGDRMRPLSTLLSVLADAWRYP